MQKKSHKRKFKVGQMVRVLNCKSVANEDYYISDRVGKTFIIQDYVSRENKMNYLLPDGIFFSAKELEAVETPEEFFSEKETDGEIAQVLLKVLERLPIDEEHEFESEDYSSHFTCDLIRYFAGYESELEYKILDFLDDLGFESEWKSFHKFSEFNAGFERQSARFNWILFALQVAREEGV